MWRKRDNPSLQQETQNEDQRTVKENLFRAAELAILRHERIDRKTDKKHPFPSPPPRKRFDIDWVSNAYFSILKDRVPSLKNHKTQLETINCSQILSYEPFDDELFSVMWISVLA